jgi:hypothetical protein
VYHADLPTVGPGPLVGPGEQVLTESGRDQPADWYDPDLEFAEVDASVAQSTGPLLCRSEGISVFAAGPMFQHRSRFMLRPEGRATCGLGPKWWWAQQACIVLGGVTRQPESGNPAATSSLAAQAPWPVGDLCGSPWPPIDRAVGGSLEDVCRVCFNGRCGTRRWQVPFQALLPFQYLGVPPLALQERSERGA